MNRRSFTTLLGVAALASLNAACTTSSGSASDNASKRKEIDAGADGALNRLYSSVNGSQALASKATGILVFPKIIAAGLGIGGEYGEGVLRTAGQPAGYYRTSTAAFGLIAGAQSKMMVMMFMTPEALQKFQQSKGWTAGVDGSVAVAQVGANGLIDTNTARAPIVAFVVTNAGLMANLSLEGTKISKLDI
ncbi:Lipid-binding SYLF domain-containing protein [Cupriavidus sp. OV038]|jgi:lipid-binding SYLF domain-containing protein|uniref:BPSL1445 family SYLF domain-containing lipoprotein n=1 Tax=unclassified Cupriavidus TaxID=2640874 RepID=UPI0008EC474E|nr:MULTISPECIES: YSC84-related protein [unclassified Cupriavidus]SFD35461.1 Lipid-binding SYLF domain-containing protein [Cupriavidus sp. OV038]SFQ04525.1 Lipid-binding SYLF domain-containing protein [Cupriavidus sp. OV096]